MKITFELSESDLEQFRQIMERARDASGALSEDEVVANARKLLHQVWQSDASDFVRERMHRLETLIGMVVDAGWGLEDEDRNRVLQALSYFSNPEDLIPDEVPGIGFLDDAIMIDIVTLDLEHEIQAYRDFCVFRAAETSRLGDDMEELERSDWLEERRKQLHSRMRRRRRRSGLGGGGKGGSSPFSLF